jgi:hypothetical protein
MTEAGLRQRPSNRSHLARSYWSGDRNAPGTLCDDTLKREQRAGLERTSLREVLKVARDARSFIPEGKPNPKKPCHSRPLDTLSSQKNAKRPLPAVSMHVD